MDKDIFRNKVITKAEHISKPKRQPKLKQTYPATSDIVKYKEEDDFFYIIRSDEKAFVVYELVWMLDAIHANKLYSHPRNNHWDKWTEIKWPELTTIPDRLEIIFKQWSPFKPGSVVDVVIDNGFAKVVKVYE